MAATPAHAVRELIRQFAETHGATYEAVVGPYKGHDLNRVRQRAIAHVKAAHPRMSLSRLGQHFNRHCTTVRYSLHAVGVSTAREA